MKRSSSSASTTTRVRSCVVRILLVVAAVATTWVALPAEPAGAAINTSATALQLAQAMATDPTVITGASFVAKPPSGAPAGVADSGSAMGGFPLHGTTYTILSTGNASAASGSSSTTASAANGGGNVRGNTDYDVTILKVDVNVPANANCLTVGVFKFLSEEYPTFVGHQYNDAFIAELDSSTWTTTNSVISASNNFAHDSNGQVVSINSTGATSMSASNAVGTVYGGATVNLNASTPITPGSHSIYFSIFDQGDASYDSAVFLDNFKLSNVTPGSCPTGAKAPLTTAKTADASLSAAGSTNGYTITVSNPNSVGVQLNTIFDILPEGFAYKLGTTTGVTTSNPLELGRHLVWHGPFTVPGNGTVSLHFNVTVTLSPGRWYNYAGGQTGTVTVTPAVNVAPIDVTAPTTLVAHTAVAEAPTPLEANLYRLRARLTVATTGDPVASEQVKFYAGSTYLGSATTDVDGFAQLLGSAIAVTQNEGYLAVYDGSFYLGSSSDDAPLLRVFGNDMP